jgi:hypothetical protein
LEGDVPISYEDCAPYLSTTLLKIEGTDPPTIRALREGMIARLRTEIGKEATIRRKIRKVHPSAFKHNEMDVAWVHYSETRPPPWYIGDELKEERHHVIFLALKGQLTAMTFSDPAFRALIVAEVRRSRADPFRNLKVLSVKEVNDAFVGDRVRTLWLSGAHPRTATKADSKILTGIELEAALNPIEDQSYYFSSVRSTLDSAILASAVTPSVVIGANPRNARVWLGPSKDWLSFIGRLEALIDEAVHAVANPSNNAPPLPILAQPMEGLAPARSPYDMAIIVPEAVSAGTEDDNEDLWLHEFSDAVRFVVTPKDGVPSFEAHVFWGSEQYGTISYEFSERVGASVVAKATAASWRNDADHHEPIRNICENVDLLTVYYDTGHTFSRGVFYETRFRDARFGDWRWVSLNGFNVSGEKPLIGKRFAIENIGNDDDDSLFGFVARYWPNYVDRGVSTGWLVCDDGSMESADFVHFDVSVNPPHLTLVHVKGSGSSNGTRGLSVSDYEVVVGQAVKNLRYLDRSHIHDKLAANRENAIGTAVWRDGVRQRDRTEILKVLANVGANVRKTVCIFQPSARKGEVQAIGTRIQNGELTSPAVRRLQQLDALLLAARAECLGLGAEFYVIGEDDT